MERYFLCQLDPVRLSEELSFERGKAAKVNEGASDETASTTKSRGKAEGKEVTGEFAVSWASPLSLQIPRWM